MRAFKIFATPKRVFKIVADTFPRLATLIFNNTNTIELIGLIGAFEIERDFKNTVIVYNNRYSYEASYDNEQYSRPDKI